MDAYRRTSVDASAARLSPPCPRCNGPLVRVRRHFFDRVVGLFRPVRRYRCDSFACRWEGTLRARRADAAPGPAPGPTKP